MMAPTMAFASFASANPGASPSRIMGIGNLISQHRDLEIVCIHTCEGKQLADLPTLDDPAAGHHGKLPNGLISKNSRVKFPYTSEKAR